VLRTEELTLLEDVIPAVISTTEGENDEVNPEEDGTVEEDDNQVEDGTTAEDDEETEVEDGGAEKFVRMSDKDDSSRW